MNKVGVNWIISASLFAAILFMLIPLPDWAALSRPDFISLVLMYWWLAHPEKVGVYTGFLMGLLLDVMYGSLLGQHAIGCVFIAWLFVKQHQRIRVLPLPQQAMMVFFALLLKQFISFWIDSSNERAIDSILLYFSPCLIGGLIWPWLFVVMRDLRRKYS
jgi:rod shape-determining protein MreD